jgi:hypothetical protein
MSKPIWARTFLVSASLAASFLLGLLATSADATILPVEGGSGGSFFQASCGSGQYVVGFSVGAGAWIDRLALLCAPYQPATGKFGGRITGEFHGGSGGSPQEAYCSTGYIIGIEFGYTVDDGHAQYVDDVQMMCSSSGGQTPCIATGEGCGAVNNETGGAVAGGFILTPFLQYCPAGEAVTGLQGRSGNSLDAMGLICGPAPAPLNVAGKPVIPGTAVLNPSSKILPGAGVSASQQTANLPKLSVPGSPGANTPAQTPSYPLSCRGGGTMVASATGDGFVRITFAPAGQASTVAAPRPGECAWSDRGFRPGEPQMMVYALSAKNSEALLQAAKSGGTFQVHAYNNSQGAMVVSSIDAVAPVANLPSTLPGPGQPTGPVGPAQPATGGTVARLIQNTNVRNGSGSPTVIGSLPAGTQVVIAACDPLWCQLATPFAGQIGWVWRQFLQFSQAGPVPQAPAGPFGSPPTFPPAGFPPGGFPPAAG